MLSCMAVISPLVREGFTVYQLGKISKKAMRLDLGTDTASDWPQLWLLQSMRVNMPDRIIVRRCSAGRRTHCTAELYTRAKARHIACRAVHQGRG